MSTTLYVGNLPFEVSSKDLAALFEPHGEVLSANVVQDRETGRSRGFGFVEMADPEAAALAIEVVNGMDLKGRNLVVNESRERHQSGPRRSGSWQPGGGQRGQGSQPWGKRGPSQQGRGAPPRRSGPRGR